MKPWTHLPIAALLMAVLSVPAQAQVTGAGSTFAQLILERWSGDFQRAQADKEYQPVGTALDYEPIGSQGGLLRVKEAAVDFGATDVPLPSAELTKLGLAQFPIVIGGVVVVANLDGIGPGQLRLTGALVADIYQAKVQTWADPAIKALNPDLALPDAPIVVVHRADGSGTTFNFTNFLAGSSPSWQSEVGHDLLVRWPTGVGMRRNEGVADTVKATRNAIGYVDFAQAERAKLSYALIRNSSGAFVRPSVPSFQAAAASADWGKTADFDLLLTDAPAAGAYPITATTFALMPLRGAPTQRTQAALAFFGWSLDNGAAAATQLGYVALPPSLVTQVKDYWASRLPAAR